MNILAINTAFSKSYVSMNNGNTQIYKSMDSSLKQSENILGLIDLTLKEGNIKISDIDVISVVIGPGSFTGIRIGASIAKGICMPLKSIKKVAINSLDLVAYSYAKRKPNQNFWVVLNALSGNLFACKYSSNGEKLCEHKLISGNNYDEINGLVVGIDEEYLEICNEKVNLNSQDLLEYSIYLCENDGYVNDFVPVYIRKSQAEENMVD